MKTCVIIPCYKVLKNIETVLKAIDLNQIDKVFVIDDNCPEKTGDFLKRKNISSQIEIIILNKNLGVGGATLHGFKKALSEKFELIFKIDGDGQHDPSDLKKFLHKFENNKINFCKGTRFNNTKNKNKIPKFRLIGNIVLTKISRITCKNENLTDVVNGFFAIRHELLEKLDLDKISKGYFFEEDLLFHISFYESNIYEIPIKTIYFGKSSLSPIKTIIPFLIKHLKNLIIRIFYEFTK